MYQSTIVTIILCNKSQQISVAYRTLMYFLLLFLLASWAFHRHMWPWLLITGELEVGCPSCCWTTGLHGADVQKSKPRTHELFSSLSLHQVHQYTLYQSKSPRQSQNHCLVSIHYIPWGKDMDLILLWGSKESAL